jgi:predicted PurR-regulated permease PerM
MLSSKNGHHTMPGSERLSPILRFLAGTAAVIFIAWGISQAQTVVVSVLVSVFLAVLATPPVLWLEEKGCPTLIAVAVVVLGMIFFLLAVGAVVGTSINSFYAALPQYQESIHNQLKAFREFLASKSIDPPEELLLNYVNPSAVMSMTAGLFARLGSAFSNIVLIVLTVTFILLETSSFPVKLRKVLGDPQQAFPELTKLVDDMKRYMVIKTLMSVATGALVAAWLAILQVDFYILWGFLAFLLNYVPSIGSTIAGIPAVLLAFIQLGVLRALLVAAGYVVVNLVVDYGIEKRLMGRKLGLSTLVVFMSLILWGSLLGPIGAVLCIPLTMSLKFMFETSEETKWIGVLLGPEDVPSTATP